MKAETSVGLFILAAIGVFLYLSINIRAFRFDKGRYNEYKAYFDDTGGIAEKAKIRIAGVEVGWVSEVNLLPGGKAELMLRIHQQNKLAKNAFAMINQEGLIGSKTVEIDPGDPSTGLLLPGSTLSMPGKTPASVGEMMEQFRDIASGIQDITSSIKSVFATRQGEQNMKEALDSIAKASDRMADFSLVLQRTLRNNEENIGLMIDNFKHTATELRTAIPSIKQNVHDVSSKFGTTADEVSKTFKEAGHIAEKINTGKGTVGKLINEDETYGDIKKSIRGFKDYISRTQAIMLNVDFHSETMLRHTSSKGYFELKLRTNSDFFYVLQLVADEQGSISRECTSIKRMDEKGNVLRASQLDIPLERKIEFADEIETITRKKDDILFGLQFGKRFNRFAFRIGMFENSFGAACDFYVPLSTDKLHWITTIEGFDFRGRKRINDSRPYVKWINKVYFMKNMYTSFGLNDIFSKNNANPFFGGGFRFGDDDLKYLLSSLPIGSIKGS